MQFTYHPFIAIEGLEGASKTTSINTVRSVISAYMPVVQTREPGGTPIAERLRTIAKEINTTESLSGLTELLLMSASRLQLFDNVIMSSLPTNCVISDRSWLSTFAYQCIGRQIMTPGEFGQFYELFMKHYRPYDLIIYLDIPPEVGLERARNRGALDRFEQEEIAFFHRVREGYNDALHLLPQAVRINADRSVDEVQGDVRKIATEFISAWKGPTASHPVFV